MGALLKFIFTIPFIAALFWLSFANRAEVKFAWSPVHEPLTVAVSVLLLAAVACGFVWGALITWLNYAPVRRDRRHAKKTMVKLEKELTLARAKTAAPVASADTPPPSSLPASPTPKLLS